MTDFIIIQRSDCPSSIAALVEHGYNIVVDTFFLFHLPQQPQQPPLLVLENVVEEQEGVVVVGGERQDNSI